MSRPIIDRDECTGCGICVDSCPNEVLDISAASKAVVVSEESCIACGECLEECPMGAIVDIEE